MTKLLLVSELTEARKFSRDDRLRSGTPGPEAAPLKTPTLSRSWTLISIVVVHRNADGDRDHRRAIDTKRHYDGRDRRSKAQGCRPAQGAGFDACTQNARCLSSAQLTFSPLSSERCVAGRNANYRREEVLALRREWRDPSFVRRRATPPAGSRRSGSST
jgi:hypothetical protein